MCAVISEIPYDLANYQKVWDLSGQNALFSMVISLLYVTGPLAFYGIWCYNGERKNRIPKYAYYLFYPLHLLVLGGIAMFC